MTKRTWTKHEWDEFGFDDRTHDLSDREVMIQIGSRMVAVCAGCNEIGSGLHTVGDDCGLCGDTYTTGFLFVPT